MYTIDYMKQIKNSYHGHTIIIILFAIVLATGVLGYVKSWSTKPDVPTTAAALAPVTAAPASFNQLVIAHVGVPVTVKQLGLELTLTNQTLDSTSALDTVVVKKNGVTIGTLTFNQIGQVQTIPGYTIRLANAFGESAQFVFVPQA